MYDYNISIYTGIFMNLQQVTTFTFKAKDGIHSYVYNSSAGISTFLLIVGKEIAFRHDCYCMDEERHLARISNDFSENCIEFNRNRLWAKYKPIIRAVLIRAIALTLYVFTCIVFCLLFVIASSIEFIENSYRLIAKITKVK